jgi:sugar lactone lactonase YvrE
VAVFPANGGGVDVYLSSGNNTIPMIDPSDTVTVIAGSDAAGSYADGQGALARFDNPLGIAVDAVGDLLIADTGNNRIRRVDPLGNVTTIAGNSTPGFSNGQAMPDGGGATFSSPNGIAIDPNGFVYVSDHGNSAIRKIGLDGNVSTLAGPYWPDGGVIFGSLAGITVDPGENVFVSDNGNECIWEVTSDGTITLLAGSGSGVPGWVDAQGSNARFDSPKGLAVDQSGNVIVADQSNAVLRLIDRLGYVTTLAGVPDMVGFVARGRAPHLAVRLN